MSQYRILAHCHWQVPLCLRLKISALDGVPFCCIADFSKCLECKFQIWLLEEKKPSTLKAFKWL